MKAFRTWCAVGLLATGCVSSPPPPVLPPPPRGEVSFHTGRAFDPKNEVLLDQTDSFGVADNQVVFGVTLSGYSVGTRCEIVLYRNTKFLELLATKVKKKGPQTILVWKPTKGDSGLPSGVYRAKVFLNGRFGAETEFIVAR